MHFSLPLAASQTETFPWVSLEIALLQLATILFLVFLNGFFVASEFAIVKVRGSQIDALVSRGEKGAALARHVTEHLDAYLSATQLGITLASLALGWVGEPFLAHMMHPLFVLVGITSEVVITSVSFALAFALITMLHIVLGELAPKSLAIRRPIPTTLWVARPLHLFHRIFKPAIWLLNGMANWILRRFFHLAPVSESELAHGEEELRLILADSAKAEELSARGTDISLRAMALRHRVVREVVTHRREVVFLDAELSFSENLRRAKKSGHTRFPLCREHLDNTIGLIHIKDMIALEDEPAPDLMVIKRELPGIPEMMSLEKLLEVFLEKRAHLALTLDEFGGAVGIVTLDNVIEELVGEIQDEFDAEQPSMERIGEREFLLKGRLSLHEVRELTGQELESDDASTLGGYVTERLGHLPHVGEALVIGDFDVSVSAMDGRRVRQLRFKRKD